MKAQCFWRRSRWASFKQYTLCDDRYKIRIPFPSYMGVSICLKWFAPRCCPVTAQLRGNCAQSGASAGGFTAANAQSVATRSTMWPCTAPSRASTASTSHG